MSNEPARACIREDPIDLDDRKTRVDRNDDRAEPAARVHQFEVIGTVGDEKRQPVAGAESPPTESRSHCRHAVVKLAKRQAAFTDVERGLLGIVPSRSIDGMAIDH